MSIAFSPDGKRLAVSDASVHVRLLDNATCRELFVIENPGGTIHDAVFSPKGESIACGGADGTISIWDTETGVVRLQIKGHQEGVQEVRYSPQGNVLVSVSWDKTVRLWDAVSGTELQKWTDDDRVWSAAFSPDGRKLFVANGEGVVSVIDIATGKGRFLFKLTNAAKVDCSPDGKTIVSGQWGMRPCKVWDSSTGKERHTLTDRGSCSPCVAYSPDGRQVAASVGNNSVMVWDPATGQMLAQLVTGYASQRFSFSPDGKTIAVKMNASSIVIWDVAALLKDRK
jgi:WD40 repeat protein